MQPRQIYASTLDRRDRRWGRRRHRSLWGPARAAACAVAPAAALVLVLSQSLP